MQRANGKQLQDELVENPSAPKISSASPEYIVSKEYDIAQIMGSLYGDGIIGLKGAFSKEWVRQLGEDLAVLYEEAIKRPGGAVGRGPKRHYVEIHPEDIRGFIDLVNHPWVRLVCE